MAALILVNSHSRNHERKGSKLILAQYLSVSTQPWEMLGQDNFVSGNPFVNYWCKGTDVTLQALIDCRRVWLQ